MSDVDALLAYRQALNAVICTEARLPSKFVPLVLKIMLVGLLLKRRDSTADGKRDLNCAHVGNPLFIRMTGYCIALCKS